MAEEHVGPRPAPWTKIFSGFKVALDLKKLLLAAAGILVTAIGWWVISFVAFSLASKPEYAPVTKPEDEATKKGTFEKFKARRASWNLLHELAGAEPVKLDEADLADSWAEYEALQQLNKAFRRSQEKVKITGTTRDLSMEVGTEKYLFTIQAGTKDLDKEADRLPKDFTLRDLEAIPDTDEFQVGDVRIKVIHKAEKLREYRKEAADLAELAIRVKNKDEKERATYAKALKTLRERLVPDDPSGRAPEKPGGVLRTLPWYEYRGDNPYLLVTRLIKETSATQTAKPTADPRGHFLGAFGELIPVLLEPIVKILTPIIYLVHPHNDWYTRTYLILVLLYALAVWGFFGGAITRLAAVQIARNEKISLREAVLFAKDRFISFFAAPGFPLLLLAFLVFCLWIFGWVEGFIPIVGDIFIAGLFWPIVLIVGLIMAVVLVGLVGWPLMNATISVEGSDSFDALSRSYSYVYQAPWQYLWYSAVATLYGAVLVFFVGFMASLLIFLGKWGVGMTPGIGSSELKYDREPSYLFIYAPTSFGWRDLLIRDSAYIDKVERTSPSGTPITGYEFKKEYSDSITGYNRAGAVLVSVWIYIFFLLVVGFGYSYFWTAATIVYFLMRRHVDDTDMDEVHLEEEEAPDPFARPPAAPPAAPPKSDKVSLSMVDPPALRTAITPGAPPPPPTAPLAPPEPPPPPPTAPLAPPEPPPPPPTAPLAPPEPPPPPPTAPLAPPEPPTPPIAPPGPSLTPLSSPDAIEASPAPPAPDRPEPPPAP